MVSINTGKRHLPTWSTFKREKAHGEKFWQKNYLDKRYSDGTDRRKWRSTVPVSLKGPRGRGEQGFKRNHLNEARRPRSLDRSSSPRGQRSVSLNKLQQITTARKPVQNEGRRSRTKGGETKVFNNVGVRGEWGNFANE